MQVCKGHTVTLRRTPSAQGAGVTREGFPGRCLGWDFIMTGADIPDKVGWRVRIPSRGHLVCKSRGARDLQVFRDLEAAQ